VSKCKHTPGLSLSDSSGIFSSAKEKLKVLEFKLQWGTITEEDLKCLANLSGEGVSTWGLLFRLELDRDNALGLGL
jgi:hypothetical protein